MKNVSIKFLAALALLALLITPSIQAAFPDAVNTCVYRSTDVTLAGTHTLGTVRYIKSFLVVFGTATSNTTNTVQLYDSSSTVTTSRRKVGGPMDLTTPKQIFFDVSLDYGLTYVSSGTVSTLPFTIFYRER